jgi:mono/diheme cytochrome c family protein
MEEMKQRIAQGIFGVGLSLLTIAGVGCRHYPPPVPLDQLNPQQASGHAIFKARCAQCHYERVDQPRNGPSLASVFHKPTLHSGAAATDERVTSTILNGHGLMPAMGNQVDEGEIHDLLAYLHTV